MFKATLKVDGLLKGEVFATTFAQAMNDINHYAFAYREEHWEKSFVITVKKKESKA